MDDKDRIIKSMEDVLKDPKFKTLTEFEIAILLWDEVVGPEMEHWKDVWTRLAVVRPSGDSN